MKFENIFAKSYDEYKKNFKEIFLLVLILVGIPLILGNLVFAGFSFSEPEFYNLVLDGLVFSNVGFVIIIALLGIITLILYFIFEAGLFKESLSNKIKFSNVVNSGKKYFWKFIWFWIVTGFFLVLLFIAFIIPGIIFVVYWSLAVYIYFDSNKTVVQSLKSSFYMIKGNWWKIFGYSLLLFIIFALFWIALEIITLPTAVIINKLSNPSISILLLNLFLGDIASFLFTLLTAPFGILFYKNIYLELKGKKMVMRKKIKK